LEWQSFRSGEEAAALCADRNQNRWLHFGKIFSAAPTGARVLSHAFCINPPDYSVLVAFRTLDSRHRGRPVNSEQGDNMAFSRRHERNYFPIRAER
jgi:hypothetical protein